MSNREKLSRRELIENAFEAISAELMSLPDDAARAAVFLCIADEASEWAEDAYECLVTNAARNSK